jgi:autotransporter-associated beta strand protein
LFMHAGNVTVNSLRSDANNPTAEQVILDGVNLTTDGYFDAGNGVYSRYHGKFVGAGGLVKSGTGTFDPDGIDDAGAGTVVANGLLIADGSFVGPRTITVTGASNGGTITSGTLQLGSATALQNYTVGVNAFGNLDLNGFNPIFGGLTGDGTVTLTNGQTLTLAQNDNDTTFAGTLTGAGSLAKTGPGTLTITGTDQLGGTTTVNGGTLQFGNGGSTGLPSVPITDDGKVVFNLSGNATYSQNISGSGAMSQSGPGNLTLGGSDDLNGGVNVYTGNLVVNGMLDSNLSAPGDVGVFPGAEMSGNGLVNAQLDVGGDLSPGVGQSGGALRTGTVYFTLNGAHGTYTANLNSPASGYGQLVSLHDVYLTGATLNLNLGPNYTPNSGATPDQFDVIHTVGALNGTTFSNAQSSGSVIRANGNYFRVDYGTRDVTVTAIATPLASSNAIIVNDGSAQRSEVRSITVTFSTLVSFQGGAAGAFTLAHLSGINGGSLSAGSHNVILSASTANVSGHTVVTLIFSGNETDPVSVIGTGNAVPGPSLADGLYQLSTGTYNSPTDSSGNIQLGLFRLYGDCVGSGGVGAQDLGQFRTTFNSSVGSQYYLAYLDADNSGAIDSQDEGQFRTHYDASVFLP